MKVKKILKNFDVQSDFEKNFKDELLEENTFLTKLLDSIPATMYFDPNIKAKIIADKHIAMDKAAEGLKRSSNQQELSAKGKHKRSRLDPLNQKSISQIQEELNKKQKKKRKKHSKMPIQPASLTRAANIEELQKRLQERINVLQAQRKAARNNPEANKKLKMKVKKLKSKQKGNLQKSKEVDKKPEKATKENKTNESISKPVFNKEGNFLYSKFEFSENGPEKPKKNEYSGKKPEALLKQVEKKKEKFEKLKSTNPEKAEIVAEKDKWKKAIQKSEGLKVKDNPDLLKKSIKKREKRKKKSAKVWKERAEETDKRKKTRQEKRTKNIKQRKKEKLDHKIKLAKKKGRVIPGF